MPRYFFHLYNDVVALDDEGRDLPDLASARHAAESDARDMAAESVRDGRLDLSHRIEVADGDGQTLLRVTFGEVVTVRERGHGKPHIDPS